MERWVNALSQALVPSTIKVIAHEIRLDFWQHLYHGLAAVQHQFFDSFCSIWMTWISPCGIYYPGTTKEAQVGSKLPSKGGAASQASVEGFWNN